MISSRVDQSYGSAIIRGVQMMFVDELETATQKYTKCRALPSAITLFGRSLAKVLVDW